MRPHRTAPQLHPTQAGPEDAGPVQFPQEEQLFSELSQRQPSPGIRRGGPSPGRQWALTGGQQASHTDNP